MTLDEAIEKLNILKIQHGGFQELNFVDDGCMRRSVNHIEYGTFDDFQFGPHTGIYILGFKGYLNEFQGKK